MQSIGGIDRANGSKPNEANVDSNGAVKVTGSVALPSGAATEATLLDALAELTAILAKIIAAPATEAKQDTGNTSLATIAAAQPFLKSPGSHTPITPSNATDTSAVASIGLLVISIAGGTTLDVRGTTTTGTTASYGPVVAGQYIWGSFSRVMAATNCTVMGLAP